MVVSHQPQALLSGSGPFLGGQTHGGAHCLPPTTEGAGPLERKPIMGTGGDLVRVNRDGNISLCRGYCV